jgi:hypothetical protein
MPEIHYLALRLFAVVVREHCYSLFGMTEQYTNLTLLRAQITNTSKFPASNDGKALKIINTIPQGSKFIGSKRSPTSIYLFCT